MPAAAQSAAALAGGPAHQGSTCHHREAITHGPHGDPPNAAGPDALRNALCCVCMAWPGADSRIPSQGAASVFRNR